MQTTRRKMSIYMAAVSAVALPTVLLTVGAQPATAAPVDHAVATSGDTFTPSVMPGTVAVGDTVTFSGLGGHNATSTTGSAAAFASTAGAPTFVFTATTAGKYTYECTFHSGMTGSFTVAAAGAPAAPAAPAGPAAAPAAPAAAPVAPAAPADPAAAPAVSSGANPSAKGDDDDGDDHGDHGDDD